MGAAQRRGRGLAREDSSLRARSTLHSLCGAAAALAAVAAIASVAGAAASEALAATQVGFRAHSFAAWSPNADNGAVTGEKPESKLWYHDGKWWGAMVSAANGKHTIHRLDGTTWSDTGVVVDDRATTKEDVLLSGSTLYVVSRSSTQNKLRRYTYSAGTWVLSSGFPVNVPGAGAEAVTIAKDTTGRLWIAYALARKMQVAWSTGSETSFSAPLVLPTAGATTMTADDIGAIIAFTDSTGPAVGVMYSNQADWKQHFAIHRDGDGTGTWTHETALSGTEEADDHINLKTYDGRVFAVVKTEQGSAGQTLIYLLNRSRNGVWTKTPVTKVEEGNTRPIAELQIDPSSRTAYVFMTIGEGSSSNGIAYKKSSIDNLMFPAAATTFIQGPNGEVINNATSTKQNLSSSTGIVVLASDGTHYWWNRIDGAPSGNTAPTATAGSATVTQDEAATITLRGTDAETCELTFAVATQPAHGTLGPLSGAACTAGTPKSDSATVTYTPAAGYTGSDSFTFTVSDGTATSAPATVSVTVEAPASGGSIGFRGASAAGNTTGTTLVIPAPAGVASGDVLLAAVGVRGSPGITPPSGWTLARSDQVGFTVKQSVYWKVAGSAEPASYTFTFGSSQGASGTIVAYTGVDTSAPVDVAGGQTGDGTAPPTAPSVTTTTANDRLVAFFGLAAATGIGAPAGMTERAEASTTAGTYRTTTEAADQALGAAGATGSRVASTSSTASSIGQVVALRPAEGAPPPPPPPPPPGNTAPTATAGSATTTRDTAVSVTLRGTDSETCELAFAIASQPAHGTLGAIGGSACTSGSPNADTATVTYTPSAGYTGSDSFTFTVSDGTAASAPASVTLTVNAPPAGGGTISTVGSSSAGNATATTLTVPAPPGVADGHVLVAAVTVRGSPAITAPAGWTLIRSDQSGFTVKQSLYYKVAGASEPGSYTWTFASSQGAAGGIVAFSGVDTSSPVDASSGATGSGTAITAPSLTTTAADARLVGFFGMSNLATATPPTGMTERLDVSSTAGTYRASLEAADEPLGAAGSTGSRTATSTATQTNVGQLVALRPA